MGNIYGESVSTLIAQAKALATERHAHLHLYNAARSPAILHIAEVAHLVEQNGGTEDMIAAAWLHDIVEDTGVTIKEIEEQFGPSIAALVDGLTDPDHFAALPLVERKRLQAERLKEKSDDIKRIKICDQLSNTLRVLKDPPTDWDDETKLNYIIGAKAVADICRGLCPEIDTKIQKAHDTAIKRY